MKIISIFLLAIITGSAQNSRKQQQDLKPEWKNELTGNYSSVSGLTIVGDKIYITQTGDQTGSALSIFSPIGNMLYNSSTYVRIRSFFAYDDALYSMGDQQLTKRSLEGEIISEYSLPWKNGEYISSRNGRILNHCAYTTNVHNDFLKFSLSGEQLFRKEIGALTDNLFLDVGGNYVYVYSSITNPSLGSRLLQYDTLGNQNWSIAINRLVYGMHADEEGYCYMLTSETGGIGYVEKYDAEGKLIYDAKLPGQRGTNAFRLGDSLFVCGQVSGAGRVAGQKMAAFCVISAKTGEVYYQQTLDLDPEPIHQEDFTQIVSDGQNVYVGGYYGGQNKTSVLIKYSREGNTTGLKDEINSSYFGVYPNPGTHKFTVTNPAPVNGSLTITVMNSMGQVIHKQNLVSSGQNSWELDLGKQPAGNYMVEILRGTEKSIRKIIIE